MLQEVVIMKDRSTGKSRGFGFVTFQLAADAARAGNKEHMVDGRRCEVSSAPSHHCASAVGQHRLQLRQGHRSHFSSLHPVAGC